MSLLFDTNALSALVHQRQGFERLASRIESLPLRRRIVSTVTLSELRTMVAKARMPAKFALRWNREGWESARSIP